MVKSFAGSEESAEEMIEPFLDRQGADTQITDEIAIYRWVPPIFGFCFAIFVLCPGPSIASSN
jgi:hypothetical protein